MKLRKFRIAFAIVWALAIAGSIAYLVAFPDHFTPESIAGFLAKRGSWIWAFYVAISVLRGFTLLPSTPLVIAGTLLFPSDPWLVLSISIGGIFLSSTLIYYFSEFLGFDEYFEGRKPELTEKLRCRLNRPFGVFFVAAWAFFPLVPTDAVCYVAGSTRMNFPKFIAAITAGELILCSFYVFSWGYLRGLLT